jgi:hypothetical protein
MAIHLADYQSDEKVTRSREGLTHPLPFELCNLRVQAACNPEDQSGTLLASTTVHWKPGELLSVETSLRGILRMKIPGSILVMKSSIASYLF